MHCVNCNYCQLSCIRWGNSSPSWRVFEKSKITSSEMAVKKSIFFSSFFKVNRKLKHQMISISHIFPQQNTRIIFETPCIKALSELKAQIDNISRKDQVSLSIWTMLTRGAFSPDNIDIWVLPAVSWIHKYVSRYLRESYRFYNLITLHPEKE